MGFRKKKIIPSSLKSIPRSQVIRVSDLPNYCDYSNTDFLIFAAEQKIELCLLDGGYENSAISDLPEVKTGTKIHRKIPASWFQNARENLDSDPWPFEHLEIGPLDLSIRIQASDLLVLRYELERFLAQGLGTPIDKGGDGRAIRWEMAQASIACATIELLVESNPKLKAKFAPRTKSDSFNMKAIAEALMANDALVTKYDLYSDFKSSEKKRKPLTTDTAAENLRKIFKRATS